jgi:hypothetical protein
VGNGPVVICQNLAQVDRAVVIQRDAILPSGSASGAIAHGNGNERAMRLSGVSADITDSTLPN